MGGNLDDRFIILLDPSNFLITIAFRKRTNPGIIYAVINILNNATGCSMVSSIMLLYGVR